MYPYIQVWLSQYMANGLGNKLTALQLILNILRLERLLCNNATTCSESMLWTCSLYFHMDACLTVDNVLIIRYGAQHAAKYIAIH